MGLAITLISTGLAFAAVEPPMAAVPPEDITERTFQCPAGAAVRTQADGFRTTFECATANEVGHGPFWCRTNRSPRLLTCLGNQADGKLDGPLTYWDSWSGKKIYEGNYSKGRLHGLVRTWYANGGPASEEVWENGPSAHRFFYLTDYQRYGIRGRLEPNSEARIIWRYPNGQKRAEIEIKAGKTASVLLFDESGAQMEEERAALFCNGLAYACDWSERWVKNRYRIIGVPSMLSVSIPKTVRPSEILQEFESSLRRRKLGIAFSAHTQTAAVLVTDPRSVGPDLQAHYRFSLRLSDCGRECRVAVSTDRVLVPLQNGRRVPAQSRFENDSVVGAILEQVQRRLKGAIMDGR